MEFTRWTTDGALYLKIIPKHEWRSTVEACDQTKQVQERLMIACHASPEGKSSGLARIKVRVSNNIRQSNMSGGGGGGEITLVIGQISIQAGRGRV